MPGSVTSSVAAACASCVVSFTDAHAVLSLSTGQVSSQVQWWQTSSQAWLNISTLQVPRRGAACAARGNVFVMSGGVYAVAIRLIHPTPPHSFPLSSVHCKVTPNVRFSAEMRTAPCPPSSKSSSSSAYLLGHAPPFPIWRASPARSAYWRHSARRRTPSLWPFAAVTQTSTAPPSLPTGCALASRSLCVFVRVSHQFSVSTQLIGSACAVYCQHFGCDRWIESTCHHFAEGAVCRRVWVAILPFLWWRDVRITRSQRH